MLCQVLSGLTYEQEAEKFVKLNSDRQGLSANQKFAGRVESGELFAKSIVKKMADYGFSYNKDSGTKSDDVIGCISCVERITKNNGLTHLERVLMILRSAGAEMPPPCRVQLFRDCLPFYAIRPVQKTRF